MGDLPGEPDIREPDLNHAFDDKIGFPLSPADKKFADRACKSKIRKPSRCQERMALPVCQEPFSRNLGGAIEENGS
jgi:hypothetical protein